MNEDVIKKYTKKKIEYIELVQKDLEEFKNRELFLKEPLNSLTKTKETMLLSAAINLLQELIGIYELYCKDELFFKVEQNND